jgi:O-antigen/teichoic acid export membrane protein
VNDKSSNLTHRAVRGMAWVAWGSAATAGLKILVLVLLTRLLSPADFGVVGAALVVIGFSLNFSQMGLGPALVQRPVLEPGHVSTAFYASTAFGILLTGIIWVTAPQISSFFRMDHLTPVVRALALVFPITGISTVAESLLQRELRFRFLANRDVLAYGLGYGVVGLALALLGWGVWSLVVAQLTQTLVRTAILLRAAPPVLHPRPRWSNFVELMDYGAGQSAARMAVLLANQVDNLVVGRWLGAVALGLYSRAYQLMSVPTALLGDVLDKVLFPMMSRVQNEPRRLATAYLQGSAFIALVTLPAGVVAAVLGPDLIAVAFGPRWESMVPPFQVLALGMMFRTSYRMSDSLSRATGRVYRRAWRQGLYAILVFLGAWIGHYYGVTGVALGVLVALFLNYLIMAQLSLSIGRISWAQFVGVQLPAVRLTLLVGIVAFALETGTRHLGWPPIAALALGSAGAVGAALAAAILAPQLTLGEEGARVRDLLRTYVLARWPSARVRG